MHSGLARLAAFLTGAVVLAAVSVLPSPPAADAETFSSRLAPSKLKVDMVDGRAVLNWRTPTKDGDSVTGYQILRRRPGVDAVGDFDTIVVNTGNTDTTYIDSDLPQSSSFTSRVKAWRDDDLSQWSNYKRINLNAPSDLSVSLVDNYVTLTWETPTVDALSIAKYMILRRHPRMGWSWFTRLGFTEADETTFVDKTAIKPGLRYSYRVVALRYKSQAAYSRTAFIDLPDSYVSPKPEHIIVPKAGRFGGKLDPDGLGEGSLGGNTARPRHSNSLPSSCAGMLLERLLGPVGLHLYS